MLSAEATAETHRYTLTYKGSTKFELTHQKCDMENGMAHLYAIQLKYANKTIQTLREEFYFLRKGDQQQKKEADEKILTLILENQALKSKLNILQMQLDMVKTQPFSFVTPEREKNHIQLL
ncbi:uncharacterized protein VP01_969g1 [Puccinia sorghi]|uniref:Uncharacterized protein n=1 Tax=Puccinia sorghi TaxID=27349 RepID=A0A0L6U840_9BASI|nr:uncharacterized protein VP01_969g1 [Puccinia sorghi]